MAAKVLTEAQTEIPWRKGVNLHSTAPYRQSAGERKIRQWFG